MNHSIPESYYSLALLIGNRPIITCLRKAETNQIEKTSKTNSIDQKIINRLYILLSRKNLTREKIKSPEIYYGICSRQNWYYRVVSSQKRLLNILNGVLKLLKKGDFITLAIDLRANSKPLFTKTNRLNYSEGLRSLRSIEICAFLNFTTTFE